MGSSAALAVVLCLLAIPATQAFGARFKGSRTVANPSHNTSMPTGRAKRIAVRVIHRVFAVRRGTDIFLCSRHSRRESGCDFAFTSRYGNYTCGNAVVRAWPRRIVVRYVARNSGCSDF